MNRALDDLTVEQLLLMAAWSVGLSLWTPDPYRSPPWSSGLLLADGRTLWNPLLKGHQAFSLANKLRLTYSAGGPKYQPHVNSPIHTAWACKHDESCFVSLDYADYEGSSDVDSMVCRVVTQAAALVWLSDQVGNSIWNELKAVQ